MSDKKYPDVPGEQHCSSINTPPHPSSAVATAASASAHSTPGAGNPTNGLSSDNNQSSIDDHRHDSDMMDGADVEMIQVKKRKSVGSYKFKHLATCYQFGPWIKKQREAICVFCNKRMAGSKPGRLASHINNCDQAPSHAKEIIANELISSKRALLGSPSAIDDTTVPTPNTNSNKTSRARSAASGSSRYSFEETDRALAAMMMATNLPLNFVEMPTVKEFFRLLDPNYKLPTTEMIRIEVRRGRTNSSNNNTQ